MPCRGAKDDDDDDDDDNDNDDDNNNNNNNLRVVASSELFLDQLRNCKFLKKDCATWS
jgi:hypothetical protein